MQRVRRDAATERPSNLLFLRVLVVAVAVGCALLLSLGVRDVLGHGSAGLPDRIHFEGRDYNRGQSSEVPSDAVESGRTSTGEDVYKPGGEVGLSVLIWVSDDDETREYALVGGP